MHLFVEFLDSQQKGHRIQVILNFFFCIKLVSVYSNDKNFYRWTSEDDKTPYDFTDYSILENCNGKNMLMKTGFILFHCGIINIYIYVLP